MWERRVGEGMWKAGVCEARVREGGVRELLHVRKLLLELGKEPRLLCIGEKRRVEGVACQSWINFPYFSPRAVRGLWGTANVSSCGSTRWPHH